MSSEKLEKYYTNIAQRDHFVLICRIKRTKIVLNSIFRCELNQLCNIAESQFEVNIFSVSLDRKNAQVKLIRDFLIRQAGFNVSDNLYFTKGKVEPLRETIDKRTINASGNNRNIFIKI